MLLEISLEFMYLCGKSYALWMRFQVNLTHYSKGIKHYDVRRLCVCFFLKISSYYGYQQICPQNCIPLHRRGRRAKPQSHILLLLWTLYVCLSVCLFTFNRLENGQTSTSKLQTGRTQILRGVSQAYLELRKTNRSDATCRKPDTGRENEKKSH